MAPAERGLGRKLINQSCSLDRKEIGQEQEVAERAVSEGRVVVRRGQEVRSRGEVAQEVRKRGQEVPAWLRWSREQLGETPQFLIGTGCHKSKRIGGLGSHS